MLKPSCLPVLIGSLPVTDHLEAVDLILKYTPEIPLWPQLPKRSGEGMIRQFLSGFPGLVDDHNRYWIDTARERFTEEMTAFYEEYIQVETGNIFLPDSRFKLDDDTAPGFRVMLDVIDSLNYSPLTLKGQLTGPVTTGIGIKDTHGKSIFYDDNLRDMLVKHLSRKAAWQVTRLLPYTGSNKPLVFIDEPGFVSFGSSAFTGISRQMVTDAVAEVIAAIQTYGGLAGIHICANGDWGPALESNTDIISFDAYSYFDNFILYRDQLTHFIERGGILAWGITPTGDPDIVTQESTASLYRRWESQLKTLSGFGFSEKLILEQTLISPACGTGSLPLELADKVLRMTREISQLCRRYLQEQ